MLRLGKPRLDEPKSKLKAVASKRSEDGLMEYVYILQSVNHPKRFYTGVTHNLKQRLNKHNALEVVHTAKYAPWILKTYIAFANSSQAFAFEQYLKTASGRAFAKKRL